MTSRSVRPYFRVRRRQAVCRNRGVHSPSIRVEQRCESETYGRNGAERWIDGWTPRPTVCNCISKTAVKVFLNGSLFHGKGTFAIVILRRQGNVSSAPPWAKKLSAASVYDRCSFHSAVNTSVRCPSPWTCGDVLNSARRRARSLCL